MVTGVAIGFETANGASFDAIKTRFGIDCFRNLSKLFAIYLRLALWALLALKSCVGLLRLGLPYLVRPSRSLLFPTIAAGLAAPFGASFQRT